MPWRSRSCRGRRRRPPRRPTLTGTPPRPVDGHRAFRTRCPRSGLLPLMHSRYFPAYVTRCFLSAGIARSRSSGCRLQRPPDPPPVSTPAEVLVLVSCWSAKGGSGTTVVAASLASCCPVPTPPASCSPIWPATARPCSACPSPTRRVWPAGSMPARPCPPMPWPGSRSRSPGLALLPRGRATCADRADVLAQAARPGQPTGGGRLRHPPARCGRGGGGRGGRSLLVTRPCYLSLRRALAAPSASLRGVVVREPGRALAPATSNGWWARRWWPRSRPTRRWPGPSTPAC